MDYRIVDKPAFKVIGKGIRVSAKDGENNERISEFWWECYQNGFSAELEKMADKDAVTGQSKLGVCLEQGSDPDEFTFFIGTENRRGTIPDGFTEIDIPAATWRYLNLSGLCLMQFRA